MNDFETDYDESDYWGMLFLVDSDWMAIQVAAVIHRILELYPPAELQQMRRQEMLYP